MLQKPCFFELDRIGNAQRMQDHLCTKGSHLLSAMADKRSFIFPLDTVCQILYNIKNILIWRLHYEA